MPPFISLAYSNEKLRLLDWVVLSPGMRSTVASSSAANQSGRVSNCSLLASPGSSGNDFMNWPLTATSRREPSRWIGAVLWYLRSALMPLEPSR
ncbi:hypothetical protein D3C75_972800 [compost metagenome]